MNTFWLNFCWSVWSLRFYNCLLYSANHWPEDDTLCLEVFFLQIKEQRDLRMKLSTHQHPCRFVIHIKQHHCVKRGVFCLLVCVCVFSSRRQVTALVSNFVWLMCPLWEDSDTETKAHNTVFYWGQLMFSSRFWRIKDGGKMDDPQSLVRDCHTLRHTPE